MQVVMTYFNPAMATEDLESAISVEWYYLLGSIILTTALSFWFIKQKAKKTEDEISAPITQNLN